MTQLSRLQEILMKKDIRKILLAVPLLVLFFASNTQADSVLVDPVDDFLPTYAEPQDGDQDVTSARVSLIGTSLLFAATFAADLGRAPGFYIWGVDRGAGSSTANFSSSGLPNIVLDTITRVNGIGQAPSVVAAVSTPLSLGRISISGNSFEALAPLSLLSSQGFSVSQNGQNLWPRWANATADADFSLKVTNVVVMLPESTTMLLMGLGLVGIFGLARLKRRSGRRHNTC